jgi:murein endopeptidase
MKGAHTILTALLVGPLCILSGCSGCNKEPVLALLSTVTAPQQIGPRQQHSAHVRPRRGLERPWELPEHDPDPLDDDLESSYGLALERDGADDVDNAPLTNQGPGDAYRSFSIGYPNRGQLIGARSLAHKGRHHRVLPRTIKRGYYWGTSPLVDVILQAAEGVARTHPKSILQIGNLSSARGGKITTSVSHQSGRDVDLGLFCTDLDGVAVSPDGFPVFDGSRGERLDRSGQYLLDVPRNWAMVEALLTDPKARVQWLFLDTAIKGMLLEYAIRNKRDPVVVQQAEKVIVRPKDSSPHNDHVHVRIFCSKRDLNGISSTMRCQEYGPDWTWEKEGRKTDEDSVQRRVDRVMNGDESAPNLSEVPDAEPNEDSPAPKSGPKSAPKEKPTEPPTDIDITF